MKTTRIKATWFLLLATQPTQYPLLSYKSVMPSPFVLSYSLKSSTSQPSEGALVSGRDIVFKSISPFAKGQFKDIGLEIVEDTNPSGEVPSTPEARLSFAVALCDDVAPLPIDLKTEGSYFPSSSVRIDTTSGRPFAWGGRGGSAIAGSTNTISFDESSEIASSLLVGDYLYVILSIEKPDSTEEESTSTVIERAPPVVLGSRSSESSGLGPGKNVVPQGTENKNAELRQVKIGWHPILGKFGRAIGKLLARKHQHWAVFVGGYYHELGADTNMKVVYQNGKFGDEQFDLEDVGYTTFNDQAIVNAGNIAIKQMDQDYGLINNNCQRFAINLLNIICQVGRKRLDTSYAPAQQVPGPEFKYNEETGQFELVEPPKVEKKDEEPPAVIVSTQLFESPYMVVGGELTDESVPLTEEEQKMVIEHAVHVMGGY
ncbi:hypothetical protein D9613_001456 [Agrocybe pediades]|uniref:PPPDE domain-containing protein n=1 Tax=Agrocybe pediades TaxID=84607 RepID=A0A8H4R4W1_9AGAR|nr:hypothetical protein D9613_001456 [Agrocybe pediades]